MSRRIEIELTSARPDGTWTWRAAGARQPKGVLDGGLLQSDAKPGDVLKAEADFELEGIVITSVMVPKPEQRREPERIEIVSPAHMDGPGVTTQLVGRSARRTGERSPSARRDRDDAGRRPPRPRREEGDRAGSPRGRPQAAGRADGDRSDTSDHRRADRRPSERRSGEGRSAEGRSTEGRPADEHRSGRSRSAPSESTATTRATPSMGARGTTSRAERSRPRRLNPGNTHRKAVLDSLSPEQRLIAEQVLRGGIPAVRTALHLEREKAQAEGRPAPNTDELVAMAEALVPRLRAAEWRDRAEAVTAAGDEISMRDLRSAVAGADVARDDETRALAASLREALERRVTKLHQDWIAEIASLLDGDKVVRALRQAARPPEPTARLDADLLERLASAAGAAMSAQTPPDLWAALLEAVAGSPVRRTVVPSGLPDDAPPDLKRTAHQLSGNVPALTKLLGVAIPPPPAPMPGRRRQDGQAGGARKRTRPASGGSTSGGSAPEAATSEALGIETPTAVAETPTAAAETAPAPEASTAEPTPTP